MNMNIVNIKESIIMTDAVNPTPKGRRPPGAGVTWKSGILTLSLAGVLAGSALVARLDQLAPQTETSAASPAVATVQPGAPTSGSTQTQTRRATRLSPSQPGSVFQQPVTRTRRS